MIILKAGLFITKKSTTKMAKKKNQSKMAKRKKPRKATWVGEGRKLLNKLKEGREYDKTTKCKNIADFLDNLLTQTAEMKNLNLVAKEESKELRKYLVGMKAMLIYLKEKEVLWDESNQV